MDNNEFPQFFTPSTQNYSVGIRKVIENGLEELEASQIIPRNSQTSIAPQSSVAIDGIPGIPFEQGTPNPDVFSQGEDIIYDLYLYYAGKPVIKEDFEIFVTVKTSPRAGRTVWEGSLEDGVYSIDGGPGYYELWIPSSTTGNLYAGSYYLDLMIQERLAAGVGRYDRKHILLKTNFNIDYSNFSPNPENKSSSKRSSIESTWPNSPNTIGTRRNIQDNYYIDPT